MDEEMRGDVWRKAIPEGRDRMQSRALVWVAGTALIGVSVEMVRWALSDGHGADPLWTLTVSVAFALMVVTLRAATGGGAVCGGMICLLVTFGAGGGARGLVRSGLTPLAVLFVLTFVATRAGRRRKIEAGVAEGSRRSAAQVIANLLVAGVFVAPVACRILGGGMNAGWVGGTMKTMGLAAMVEAAADTVASEIGQAFGGRPVMLTSLRRVAAGTDGAVTVLGSSIGIAGGIVVAGAGIWAMHLGGGEAAIALTAGVLGLFFDSLLGATAERRGWLGNDLVNFASTLLAAGAAAAGCLALWN